MLEDLRDKGIDIDMDDMDDEEEIEKRMREYNEESEYEEVLFNLWIFLSEKSSK